jgi:hypothetical protein
MIKIMRKLCLDPYSLDAALAADCDEAQEYI